MSTLIKTFSNSFIYDLDPNFQYTENYIKKFLSKLPDFLEDKKKLKDELCNYQKLKTFLGKKRKKDYYNNYIIDEKECKQNESFFKIHSLEKGDISFLKINEDDLIITVNNEEKENLKKQEKNEENPKNTMKPESLENSEKQEKSINAEKQENLKIKEISKNPENQSVQNQEEKKIEQKPGKENSQQNQENQIIQEQNNFNKQIMVYDKPIITTELYPYNSLKVNLINDNECLNSKNQFLDKYNYSIYTLDNKDNLITANNISIFENEEIKTLNFQNINIKPFLIIINSKIPEILDSDLIIQNIYPKKELDGEKKIYGNDISKIFFYYFNIGSDLQKNYEYILSDKRIIFNKILQTFLFKVTRNILIIAGPKGIGKTASLLYFSFIPQFRVFYFNLEVFNNNMNKNNKIKELKIQLSKLFGNFTKYDNSNIKQSIENYIQINYNTECLEFIYNIIKQFLIFSNNVGANSFCFIIDQYSIAFNEKKKENIKKIIELFNDNQSIKLVLCPTINNIFAKSQIDYLFENSLNINKASFIDIYYFQELISKEQILNNIINEETDEYIKFIEEVGYLPKLYYDSKNSNINNFKAYLKENIKSNINEYYISDNKNKEKMNIKLLELLDLVKSEKLICSVDFRKHISEFPLKYLKIIKYKINNTVVQELSKKINDDKNIFLQYLNFLFTISENNKYDSIIETKFKIEEREIKLYLENYCERDKSSINIYGDYYKTFIDNNNTYFHNNEKKQNYIFVYKLEFSMYFFEDIIYEYLYNHKKLNMNFLKI